MGIQMKTNKMNEDKWFYNFITAMVENVDVRTLRELDRAWSCPNSGCDKNAKAILQMAISKNQKAI